MSAICSFFRLLFDRLSAGVYTQGMAQLTYRQSALILISAGVGAVLGGFFWGWMGDRIGRRKVFILTALNVAFATGMMFFTPAQTAGSRAGSFCRSSASSSASAMPG
jgi:MFS family permease